jgi:hypothetical protein
MCGVNVLLSFSLAAGEAKIQITKQNILLRVAMTRGAAAESLS